MADMTMANAATNPCCAPEQQATCCTPSAKADCCGRGDDCDCQEATKPVQASDVRAEVEERYAGAARAVAESQAADIAATSCCSPALSRTDASGEPVFGGALYESAEAAHAPDSAVAASLGCGVPTAVADLKEGETVLDLGSGAGADVLISARRVGPNGKAIGLDMTDEMLALAAGGSSKLPSRAPASWTSRSARPTASMTRPPQRSCAHASRSGIRHERRDARAAAGSRRVTNTTRRS